MQGLITDLGRRGQTSGPAKVRQELSNGEKHVHTVRIGPIYTQLGRDALQTINYQKTVRFYKHPHLLILCFRFEGFQEHDQVKNVKTEKSTCKYSLRLDLKAHNGPHSPLPKS